MVVVVVEDQLVLYCTALHCIVNSIFFFEQTPDDRDLPPYCKDVNVVG